MNNIIQNKHYRNDIDVIKTISIIAVVLYHVLGEECSTGYLGVDVFFVIGGFLVIPNILNAVVKDEFKYFTFIKTRIERMLPLLVMVCFVVVVVAICFMVPEDLLTVVESSIASIVFANNYLSLFLCADYWDWTNEFKPLMHTWYSSVLMQLYVVVPLIMLVVNKLIKGEEKRKRKAQIYLLFILSIISISFFIFCNRNELRFYLLTARAYEFVIGGIVGIIRDSRKESEQKNSNICKAVWIVSLIGIIFFLFVGCWNISFKNDIFLLMVVICTIICIYFGIYVSVFDDRYKLLGFWGKASFSIFLWHQVILAFYRYFISCEINFRFWVIYIPLLSLLSYLSYQFIEKNKLISIQLKMKVAVIIALILCFAGLGIWSKAGILYDIPELDIEKDNIERRKNPKYVDRIYDLDTPFNSNEDKIKVLVIGNSFARDFANCLLESRWAEKIDLKYSFGKDAGIQRVLESDYIFVFGSPSDLPDYYFEEGKLLDNIYGIGTKNFGECVGQYFINRKKTYYFEQTGIISAAILEQNNTYAEEWGNHYINIIDYLKNDDGTIKIFTDDKRYISYDMHHLARAGAQYLGQIIDFDSIFEE